MVLRATDSPCCSYGSTLTTLLTLPIMLAGSLLMCALDTYVGLCLARILQVGIPRRAHAGQALGMQPMSFGLIVDEMYRDDAYMRQVGLGVVYTGWAAGSFLMPSVAGA